MNGWIKRYSANILTVIIIAVTVIATATATTATIKSDVSYLKSDVSKAQATNDAQDEVITELRIQLGRMDSKLDILLKKGGS